MKMYFKTRQQARTMAKASNKKAPSKKDSNGKWAINIR